MALKRSFPTYFSARWNGHRPARSLFWWDLTIVGTLVNGVMGLISLILLAKGVDGSVWLALHLLLIPYNLFLVFSAHRSTRTQPDPQGRIDCLVRLYVAGLKNGRTAIARRDPQRSE